MNNLFRISRYLNACAVQVKRITIYLINHNCIYLTVITIFFSNKNEVQCLSIGIMPKYIEIAMYV